MPPRAAWFPQHQPCQFPGRGSAANGQRNRGGGVGSVPGVRIPESTRVDCSQRCDGQVEDSRAKAGAEPEGNVRSASGMTIARIGIHGRET